MDTVQIAEFWSQVDVRGLNDCWEWKARRWAAGYGRYLSMFKAHRIAYELHNGPISALAVVRHECDNPPCCNPKHLVIGTNNDNMLDKRVRGRSSQQWGESHGMAKLTDAQCEDIRGRFDAGESCSEIHSSGYQHVSYGGVWAIARRLTRTNGTGVTKVSESGAFRGPNAPRVVGPHANSIISDDEVREIRRRYLAGETAANIHRTSFARFKYGTIAGICSGKKRKNVA